MAYAVGKLVVTVQWRLDIHQVTMAETRLVQIAPRVHGRGLGVWKAFWSGRQHSRELQGVQAGQVSWREEHVQGACVGWHGWGPEAAVWTEAAGRWLEA